MSARRKRGARNRRLGGVAAVILLIAAAARAQIVNELEPDRPLTMEDAHPLPYRAMSSSVDWTSNWGEGRHDYGPGFSFTYGLARALELGASLRYVTSPDVNASRGISSGDLLLHALYGLTPETASWPALAVRVGVEFPTGLDSKGTDPPWAASAPGPSAPACFTRISAGPGSVTPVRRSGRTGWRGSPASIG